MIPRYRAWIKEDKEMVDVEEIHFFNGKFDFIGDAITWMCKSDDCVLMQSTGLKDKNGKEIFEGDIVRVDGFKNIVVKFGKIEHQENGGGGAIYQGFNLLIEGGYPEAVMSDFEIVGNVFENIHLL